MTFFRGKETARVELLAGALPVKHVEAFGGANPSVTHGPFAETKELVAGYWVCQVRSMEEAVSGLSGA
jgi:hypothetical protein